ncbi:MAG: hypothetical protein V4633_16990 [Pseudomonadota bacterium]
MKDTRGFFVLPQAPEGAGYYTYGTPRNGAGQYADPKLMSLILSVEHDWLALDRRKFGVGNISLANGSHFKPHRTHDNGLAVDIRPLRKDGRQQPVSRFDAQYDREATSTLIALFCKGAFFKLAYFNDIEIPGVRYCKDHDDHFHIELV